MNMMIKVESWESDVDDLIFENPEFIISER